MQDIRRGDIWFIQPAPVPGGGTVGNEMWSGRPGVIVSNDTLNQHSGVVQVVYLTSSDKRRASATHVVVHANNQRSIAICNQVTNIDTSRLSQYIGRVSSLDLYNIQNSIAFALGLGGAKPGEALHKWEKQLSAHGINLFEQELSLNDDINYSERIEGLKKTILQIARERDALATAIRAHSEHSSMYQELNKVFGTPPTPPAQPAQKKTKKKKKKAPNGTHTHTAQVHQKKRQKSR